MNKYFKKFGIMFVMLLAVTGIGIFQNEAVANAASVGDALTAPESGWKRYDDTNSNFIRTGNWYTDGSSIAYNGSVRCAKTTNETFKFNFYGTKLRIIAAKCLGQSEKVSITIDGVSNLYSDSSSRVQYQSLEYEISGLTDSIHTVEIKSIVNRDWQVDAVDINDNGNLIQYNESILLDNTSLSLTVNTSKQLIVTTTPTGLGVTWTSSDSSIATVDSTGKVTGIKEGQAAITAKTADGLTATCTVTVTKEDEPKPQVNPGDANLFIELVDGQIKSYNVSLDEINKFKQWYLDRDNTKSNKPYYEFSKGSYKDYVVHDKIDWFEVK